MRLASFNVENLFARARVLRSSTWADGRRELAAFETFNRTAQLVTYDDADKQSMIDCLVTLKVLVVTDGKVVRQTRQSEALAFLRENRGDFIVERRATGIEVVAQGRADWIGWVELAVEPVDETAMVMTARVVADVAADVLAVVEAEDRPSMVHFDEELLDHRYRHVMLVDGNDPRGIDLGLLTTEAFPIRSVASHVDDRDVDNPWIERRDRRLFSRDAPVYEIETPWRSLWVVPNHLKSQSRTGDEHPDTLRGRQAARLAQIYRQLRADGAELVAVVGDFNRGPDDEGGHPSLEPLFDPDLGLVDVYGLPMFEPGPRMGTYQGCSLRERLDYIFLSPELAATVTAGGVFRTGLWGRSTNINPPSGWDIYPEITAARHAASDHAAIWIDVDLG